MTAPSRRRLAVITAILLAAAIAAALAVALSGSSKPRHRGPRPSLTGPASAAGVARLHEIQRLLRARSTAIVHHDRARFMATLDPLAKKFRRLESRMFAHVAPVPIRTWSYSVTALPRPAPQNASRYHVPTWAPEYFALHYRLGGFDNKPTSLRQYPTFVKRVGRWYLASLTDYAKRGRRSATDLWDYGPVKVLQHSDVLVIGAPSQTATMSEVAREVRSGIGEVDAVWGRQWAQRAVVLVPATAHEMALIDGFRGDLHNIAALTSAEVSTAAGHPAPVGDRITINPANWPLLSDIGAAVVIRHELTHVATRAATGTQTPVWLAEGFADYIGFRDANLPVGVAAEALKRQVDAGAAPSRLPTGNDFRSSNPQLAAHYEAAWLACRYIAERFGERTLVRFYRAVGTSPRRSHIALADALRNVLHVSLAGFRSQWRHYVASELA